MSRVKDMPIYSKRQSKIEARLYNLWLRSQHKIAYPIRFPLTGFHGMVMILQPGEWLVADENQYDLPIACWNEFQDKGRDSLHTPVDCTLRYYHYAAAKVAIPALELMHQEIQQRMDKIG